MRPAAARLVLPLALAAAGLAAGPAAAQPTRGARSPLGFEARADGIFASGERTAHVGAGASRALGSYARLTLVAGAGAAFADGAALGSARLDAFVRLTSDPFAEHARAPYAGAGVTARGRAGADPRADLLLVLGVDGRPRGGWAPALEVGLGGGVRVGLILRRLRGGLR